MTDYEQLLDLMRSRRSIRSFAERAVGRADLARVLEAARWAPSNHNRQPWKFIVLEDRASIRTLAGGVRASLSRKVQALPALASHYGPELVEYAVLFGQAPVLIVALHKPPVKLSAAMLGSVDNPTLVSGEPLSVAMAVQNLLLAAHALGLGACVMTAPLVAGQAAFDNLGLPPGFGITCLVALGYPADTPEPPRRKSLEQIVQFADADRAQNP